MRQESSSVALEYLPRTARCNLHEGSYVGLYQLSLLLTREHHKAEECFVAAIASRQSEQCVQGAGLLLGETGNIKNAIRLVQSRNGGLLSQQLVNKRDRDRPFTDSRGDAFDIAATNIPGSA